MNKKLILFIVFILIGIIICLYLSSFAHLSLSNKSMVIEYLSFSEMVDSVKIDNSHRKLFLSFMCLYALLITIFMASTNSVYKTKVISITPKIKTPASSGQGQHGTSRWATEQEKKKVYYGGRIKKNDKLIRYLIEHGYDDVLSIKDERLEDKKIINYNGKTEYLNKGGIVLGKSDCKRGEQLFFIDNDTHSLCIGATRSGKSRTMVLQSICTLGLASESMIMTDPKGELYEYTYPFLQRLGYRVLIVDFKEPLKSDKYNYLQPVIDAIDENNIPKALDAVWNLTASLVGEPKGEKIWANGEAAIIAASVLAVVYDNRKPEHKRYQNMCNVYHFISNMCIMDGEELRLSKYFNDLPEDHPSRPLLAIAEVAPPRTRGSFFTSALTTLRLFTSAYIADMTNSSSFDTKDIGDEKTALFIILPDDKPAYYSLASLLVNQIYEQIVTVADSRGGRLARRVNFILDEFGNFTAIPNFDNKLTVGGGRGIRFNIFLQDFAQLENKYGKEVAKTVRGNCETWIYLQSSDSDTLKEISNKLGTYTTTSYSVSNKTSSMKADDSSQSVSLMSRNLLNPDEIQLFERPYSLVMSSKHRPTVMFSPDLSQWLYNKMLGLGDELHNIKVRMKRGSRRKERIVSTTAGTDLWEIWKLYN